MASFLDTMAGSIYAGFKGKLRSGLIVRDVAGGLDTHGRPASPIPTGQKLEGFPDDYSEFFRATSQIPATDLKVCIFGASLKGIRPRKDDRVRLDFPAANGNAAYSLWYQLRAAVVDPAGALWTCRAFVIPAVTVEITLALAPLLGELAETANDGLPGDDE